MRTLAWFSVCSLVTCVLAAEEPSSPSRDTDDGNATGAPSLSASALGQAWGFLVPGRIRTASVDADPVNGIVVALYDDRDVLSLVRRNGGNWTRVWSKQMQESENPERPTPRILVRDLDGNGSREILVCSQRLQIYAAGAEGYALAWESPDAFDELPAPELAVADFNRDGHSDIVVLNYKDKKKQVESQSIYVYCRRSVENLDFHLAAAAVLTDEHGYHSTAGLAVDDFDGDGAPEIVAGNDNGDLWLASYDQGALAIRKHWQIPTGGAVGPGLAAGNLDDDSRPELLVGTNGGNIFVYDFDEQLEPRMAATHMAGRLAYGVAAGDLDGDGRKEFVVTRGHLGYANMTRFDVMAEAYQLHNGILERVWRAQSLDLPRPVVADFDGDGRDDIAVTSGLGSGVEVFEPRW